MKVTACEGHCSFGYQESIIGKYFIEENDGHVQMYFEMFLLILSFFLAKFTACLVSF